MALGEYVSVSSQRDSERAQLAQEERELRDTPEDELVELTRCMKREDFRCDRLGGGTELTEHDALRPHADAELGIDPTTWPTRFRPPAAVAVSFTAWRVVPLVAILLPPQAWRVPVTFVAVCSRSGWQELQCPHRRQRPAPGG